MSVKLKSNSYVRPVNICPNLLHWFSIQYIMKYAPGFVLFCLVVVNLSALEDSNDPLTRIIQDCITGSLQWRHNESDGVSNHQPHGCLLNPLSRRRSKKTSKLRDTGYRWIPMNSLHKEPVTRKMFPLDDVTMSGEVAGMHRCKWRNTQGNITISLCQTLTNTAKHEPGTHLTLNTLICFKNLLVITSSCSVSFQFVPKLPAYLKWCVKKLVWIPVSVAAQQVSLRMHRILIV